MGQNCSQPSRKLPGYEGANDTLEREFQRYCLSILQNKQEECDNRNRLISSVFSHVFLI